MHICKHLVTFLCFSTFYGHLWRSAKGIGKCLFSYGSSIRGVYVGYSWSIHGIYVCIGYVSGMYRVCIGKVSKETGRVGGGVPTANEHGQARICTETRRYN